MDANRLVDQYRLELWQCAEQLDSANEWSLSSPCVLINNGTASVVPVSSIGNHLTVCSYVEHPLIQKWLEVFTQDGFEAAFDKCLNEAPEEEGEEFARVYDMWRKDVKSRGHGEIGAGDLARFMVKAREFFPREVPVLAVVKDGGKKALMSFGVEVSSLLT